MPEPDAAQLAGKLLYVFEAWLGDAPYLKDMFARVERVGEVQRKRGPLVIETYALDLLEGPEGRGARPHAAAGIAVGRAAGHSAASGCVR